VYWSELIEALEEAGYAVRRARSPRRGPPSTQSKIEAAAKKLMDEGHVPVETLSWEEFRVMICKEIGVSPDDRGFGLDTIQNAVRPLLEERRNRVRTESTES
jgi:hypothetical protein